MLFLLEPVAKLQYASQELHVSGFRGLKVNMLCLKYTASNTTKSTTFGDMKAHR